MASSVYTVSMGSQKGASGSYTLGGPPEGYRWVVKDIDVYFGNQIGSTSLEVFTSNADTIFFAFEASEEIRTWTQWNGRHVIDYPEVLQIYVDGGNCDISCSGYQLSLP